jgi:hypothetical protein
MKRFIVLATVIVIGQPGAIRAQAKQKQDPSAETVKSAALKPGDPAPALPATKWLQGEPVTRFEPGKIYVVEFWATGCAAPIRYMPYLAWLQARYKYQAATVISFTSQGIRGRPDNTADKVAAFVKRRGPPLGYRFAYADDSATPDVWMRGREHFCTFVVDRTGRIAYVGGPMFLGMVLPKVLAAEATARAIGDEMATVAEEYEAVCANLNRGDSEAFLRKFGEFEAKYPALADFLPAVSVKLHLLFKHGKLGEGDRYAEGLIAKAIHEHNVVVLEMAYLQLSNKTEAKELVTLALRAAEAIVRIDGGKEPESLLHLAHACLLSGDKTRAKENARRAIDAAADQSSAFRQDMEKEARRLGLEQ